jgi:aminoglycoside phosphotransferase (APT) family kinase protein
MTAVKQSPAEQAKFKDLARTVIERHFGQPPRRITPKTAGLSNFVFEAKHEEGDFIVRLSPEAASMDLFLKEQWAERAAAKAGVPTAEILEVGTSVIPFPYMIVRSVSGTEATSHPKRLDIVREMGRYASIINSIRTKGYGETFEWSRNKLSRQATWQHYLKDEYRWEEKVETLDKHRLLSPAQSKQIRKIFRDATKLTSRTSLNHSDMRLKNVIADDNGKIVAIIDWEKSTSNIAPQWEFSIALHDLGIDEKQRFIEGYGLTARKIAEIAPLVKAFNMLNYTSEIDNLAAAKDKAGIERVRMLFSGVFDLYSL